MCLNGTSSFPYYLRYPLMTYHLACIQFSSTMMYADDTIHLMSDPEGNSWFCFPESPDVRGKHQDSRENKTNWFPEGPDIKWFVIFLDYHFNSNKRITAANQNSRLGTYNNTNLIFLKPLNE